MTKPKKESKQKQQPTDASTISTEAFGELLWEQVWCEGNMLHKVVAHSVPFQTHMKSKAEAHSCS